MRTFTIDRISFAIISILLFYLGYEVFNNGGFYEPFFARYWNAGQHHHIFGIAMFGVALASAWVALRKNRPRR